MDGAATPRITRGEAMQIARAVGRQPGRADRAARRRRATACPALRARLARERARASSSARKRALSVITYDDLLTRLRDDAGRGRRAAAAVARLRARYRVVLVDEFQDTDPIQWEILQRAFGAGGVDAGPDRRPEAGDLRLPRRRRLLLPGGREAAAGATATLEVNWRSDQGLIDAYDAMFGGAKLGHAGIVYRARARRPTGRRACTARRARRCGCGSSTATRSGRPRKGYASAPTRRASTSRAISPPISSAAVLGRVDRARSVASTARATSPCWCARNRARGCWSATRWTRVGVPGGDQRRGQRVRDARGARVAAAAGGARAARRRRVRARAATMTSFLGWTAERRRGGRPTRSGRTSTGACTRGRRCCAGAGWRR